MFFLRRCALPALAALLLSTQPARPARAEEPAVKTATATKPKPSPAETVLRVNGTPITRQELDRAVKVMLTQNDVQQELSPELMKQAQEAALERLASAELLYQSASTLAIKDLELQIAAKVAQSKAKIGSEADFDKALQSIDMTMKDMQDFARKDIVINNFITERFVFRAATPTEAQARAFYDENLERYFRRPESVRASHILIGADEKASPEERTKARAKAESILKRLGAGEDFAAIAGSDSTCPSKARGGDLGDFTRGQAIAPLEQAAFALKPGEISGVVESPFGYHILKLTSRQTAATERFEEAKVQILEALKQQQVQKDLSDFIDGLKKKAKIERP